MMFCSSTIPVKICITGTRSQNWLIPLPLGNSEYITFGGLDFATAQACAWTLALVWLWWPFFAFCSKWKCFWSCSILDTQLQKWTTILWYINMAATVLQQCIIICQCDCNRYRYWEHSIRTCLRRRPTFEIGSRLVFLLWVLPILEWVTYLRIPEPTGLAKSAGCNFYIWEACMHKYPKNV